MGQYLGLDPQSAIYYDGPDVILIVLNATSIPLIAGRYPNRAENNLHSFDGPYPLHGWGVSERETL